MSGPKPDISPRIISRCAISWDTLSGICGRVCGAKWPDKQAKRTGRMWTYGDRDNRECTGGERAVGWGDIPRSAGDGDNAIFLLGIRDGAERHSGAAPEIHF